MGRSFHKLTTNQIFLGRAAVGGTDDVADTIPDSSLRGIDFFASVSIVDLVSGRVD